MPLCSKLRKLYAAFFACWALTRAHLALAATAILFRPAAEILCGPEFERLAFACGDCFLNFAHLALWASAILFLAATDIVLFG